MITSFVVTYFTPIWFLSGLLGLLLITVDKSLGCISLKKTPVLCGVLILVGFLSLLIAIISILVRELESLEKDTS